MNEKQLFIFVGKPMTGKSMIKNAIYEIFPDRNGIYKTEYVPSSPRKQLISTIKNWFFNHNYAIIETHEIDDYLIELIYTLRRIGIHVSKVTFERTDDEAISNYIKNDLEMTYDTIEQLEKEGKLL